MTLGWWLDPGAIVAGAVLSFLLIVTGLVILLLAAIRFGNRLAESSELPFEAELASTEEKLERLSEKIDDFPNVIDRGKRAILTIKSARTQAVALGMALNAAGQFAAALLNGGSARPSKERGTRGN